MLLSNFALRCSANPSHALAPRYALIPGLLLACAAPGAGATASVATPNLHEGFGAESCSG